MFRHVAVLCAVAMSLASAQETSLPADVRAGMAHLRKEAFRAHMAFLADDLLEGRGTATRGHEIAARYIAAQFEALGLKPGGNSGTFYQRVPLRETTVEPEKCSASLTENGILSELKWGTDYLMRGSAVETDVSLEAPVVFVGYGVTTPDGKYDDYAGLDVKGKVVALLDGGPANLPPELRAHLSSREEKARRARDHGAIGSISLRSPRSEKRLPWDRVVGSTAFPGMRWIGPDGKPGNTFPELRASVTLSQPASERLFQHAPKTWAQVLEDARASKPQGFSLPVTLRVHEVSRHRQVTSPNVIAILAGSDPKLSREYVVYSAHADHLGIGRPINGDSIYNGAVDDASGTAALLVIASAFKSMPRPPARSILFLAVTGEEKGLLGSDYFARFPTVPKESLAADINMDEAAVLYAFKDIVSLGASSSTLGAVVERDAARLGLRVSPDPQPELMYFVRADQYSFVKQGIPVVYVIDGDQARDRNVDGHKVHEEWTKNRYHAPSDDMNQPLDFDAAAQFMQIDFLVGYDIAQDPQRPQWTAGDFFAETFARK